MSRLRRSAKPLFVLVALATIALVFSACAFLKEGSLSLSQPGGIGSVRIHFALCTEPEPECSPTNETEESQYLLGIAVPPGSTPPATLTAVPVGGGSPLTFTRNDEVATELATSSANLKKLAEKEGEGEKAPPVWPPAGLQGIGYLSNANFEPEGSQVEWIVNGDFGLPVPAAGSPFAGPFATGLTLGWRKVEPGMPASRPVDCVLWEEGEESEKSDAVCIGTVLSGQVGTSDLKLAAPAQTPVFLGGNAPLAFTANFASTAGTAPAFSLSASSTLPGAKLQLSNPTFVPGAPNTSTHLSAPATQKVTVTVPKNAKPGVYDVTLTAKTAQGASVSQVAKLKVAKAKISLGGVKLNKAKGTGLLSVKIPGAGALTITGNGVVKAKKSAKSLKKPKTLKLTIKPKGKAKKLLAEEGTAKVGIKVTFKPSSGIAVTKTKKITLKQN